MMISLITATYNSEKYLRSTFDSVLMQDYIEYEYIVIDGLSNDSTLDIIQEYEPLFEGKMRWISEPDKGLYDAMNKGIRMATGDVVGILNSDDFFTNSTVFSDIITKFKSAHCQAIYGDIHFVKPDNLSKCVRYYSSAIFRRWLMRVGFIPAHPTFYTYRKLFAQYGYYRENYKIAADFELLLRFLYINKIRTEYIPKSLVTMRTGGLSTGSLNSHKIIMREHLNAFRENGLYANRLILSLRYPYKILELFKVTKW